MHLPTLVAALSLSGAALAAPTFTGDVSADFVEPATVVQADPGGIDVGMPAVFPPTAVSGHDLQEVRLFWDRASDTLYVGLETYGIAGDADGDGDPSNTSSALSGIGGTDRPNLGGGEGFAVYLDLDLDGILDLIVGVPQGANASGFQAATFSGSPFAPLSAFGTPLPAQTGSLFASPNTAAPHVEFTIPAISATPTSSGFPVGSSLAFGAFLGSSDDADIGEDFFPTGSALELFDFGTCGDGVMQASESCDDGNSANGDGCDTTCEIEAGSVCRCAGGPDVLSAFQGPSSRFGTQGPLAGVGLCADDQVLKGVTGTYVDGVPGAVVEINPICASPFLDAVGDVRLDVEDPIDGLRPRNLPAQVPIAGYTLLCPADQAMTGLQGQVGTLDHPRLTIVGVSSMQIACSDLVEVGGAILPTGTGLLDQTVGGGTALQGISSTTCPSGQVANGIGGWGSMSTTGLRLGCAEVSTSCDRATECREFEACGDGILEGSEACDDGNAINGDGCTTDCAVQTCGDGIVEPGEDCDGGAYCSSDCRTAFALGDRVWFDADDDGNQDPGEPGIAGVVVNLYDDRGRQTDTDTTAADGSYVLYAPPGSWSVEIDSHNFVMGGALESYSRPGPTIRSRQVISADILDLDFPFIAFCGDGITQDWEGCDDGNSYNFDACTASCTVAVCGDGVLADFEICDDGNTVDGDSCSSSCGAPVCGDGQVTGDETCDDGNDDLLDGCHECQDVAVCGSELCCTLDVTAAVFPKDCNFEGAIFLNVTDANGPVSITWDDGSTASGRDPLPPGEYTVVVEDLACEVSRTFFVADDTVGSAEFVGMAAVTTGTSGFYAPDEQFTLGIIDVTQATPGDLYDAPMFHAPDWTADQIGNIFGVTYDRRGRFYVTATSSAATYLGPDVWRYGNIGGGADDLGAAGTIYRINNDGSPEVFAQLPQQAVWLDNGSQAPRFTGVGLGNIAYDRAREQFFVTNLEDGSIYRIAYDGSIEQVFDPMNADDGSPGMAPRGERVYGIEVYDNRVYYSVWSDSMDAIRSVAILPDGDLDVVSDRHEFTTNFPYFWNPVTDISISSGGRMAVAQRTMRSDIVSYNHLSDVAIYERNAGLWTFDKGWGPAVYSGHAEGYGGVAWSDAETLWSSSADMLDPRVTHGIIGRDYASIPGDWTGGTADSAMVIKYDALNFRDTKGIGGDVDIITDVEVNECIDPDTPIIED